MRLAAALSVVLAVALSARAQQVDLADISLEELGNLRVTTAAMRPERYADVPASIYVITNDDIRRSGATSLPEALRLAPNLEVSRVSGASWAISARGFQNVITNKLLVLIDGRALYTSSLSGVLWDAQDVMLEDIDRIEVISGPGAALFGANAFVGVINVVTRSALDTRGGVVVAGGGRLSRDASARVGGSLGTSAAWRVYAMHNDRDNLRPETSHVADAIEKTTVGLRTDGRFGADRWQLQAEGYDATTSGNGAADIRLKGGHVLGAWSRALAEESSLSVRSYYDVADRNDVATFIDRLSTFDIEGQYNLRPWNGHRIAVGLGYRNARDRTTPSAVVRFLPQDKTLIWRSAFAQDEIAIAKSLDLTVGARFQSAVYGKDQVLPDVRLAWKPVPQHLAWIAASGVARMPGRIDRDFFYPSSGPPFLIQGGPSFEAEEGHVYEIGYRASPMRRWTFSAVVFQQDLRKLRGGSLAPNGGGFVISNEIEGRTRGLEAWAMYQFDESLRLMVGWLEVNQDLHPRPGGTDSGGPAALGNDPRHTAKARASYRIGSAIDLDVNWRYVSALSDLPLVPSYSATDLRIAWRPAANVELSVVGSDLFHAGHVEFDEHGLPARIPRAAYAQLRWSF